jgi:hypothetical protein
MMAVKTPMIAKMTHSAMSTTMITPMVFSIAIDNPVS